MKHTTHKPRPLQTINIPLVAQYRARLAQVQQVQDDCNHILENDEVFTTSYKLLRSGYTAGTVPAHTFRNTLRWQVADCLRRAGLSKQVARVYQHLCSISSLTVAKVHHFGPNETTLV